MSRLDTELSGLGLPAPLSESLGERVATVVALAGGGTGGTALTGTLNIVSTVATSGDSVKLPLASTAPNGRIVVFNRGAQTTHVYANTGDNVNGGSASSFVTLATLKPRVFYKTSNTGWSSILGA